MCGGTCEAEDSSTGDYCGRMQYERSLTSGRRSCADTVRLSSSWVTPLAAMNTVFGRSSGFCPRRRKPPGRGGWRRSRGTAPPLFRQRACTGCFSLILGVLPAVTTFSAHRTGDIRHGFFSRRPAPDSNGRAHPERDRSPRVSGRPERAQRRDQDMYCILFRSTHLMRKTLPSRASNDRLKVSMPAAEKVNPYDIWGDIFDARKPAMGTMNILPSRATGMETIRRSIRSIVDEKSRYPINTDSATIGTRKRRLEHASAACVGQI